MARTRARARALLGASAGAGAGADLRTSDFRVFDSLWLEINPRPCQPTTFLCFFRSDPVVTNDVAVTNKTIQSPTNLCNTALKQQRDPRVALLFHARGMALVQ